MNNKALWSMDTPLYNDVIENVKAVIVERHPKTTCN